MTVLVISVGTTLLVWTALILTPVIVLKDSMVHIAMKISMNVNKTYVYIQEQRAVIIHTVRTSATATVDTMDGIVNIMQHSIVKLRNLVSMGTVVGMQLASIVVVMQVGKGSFVKRISKNA